MKYQDAIDMLSCDSEMTLTKSECQGLTKLLTRLYKRKGSLGRELKATKKIRDEATRDALRERKRSVIYSSALSEINATVYGRSSQKIETSLKWCIKAVNMCDEISMGQAMGLEPLPGEER